MQLCLALGANVVVTSSSPQKIALAKELGAVDGVNYLDGTYHVFEVPRKQSANLSSLFHPSVDAWPEHLQNLLVSNAKDGKAPLLDSIIDSAGGDICAKTLKILKQGGIVVCYGM